MLAQPAAVVAAGRPSVIVQGCGCCLGWVRHIQKSGFVTDLRETKDLDSIKQRLRIPPDLKRAIRPKLPATSSRATSRQQP